MFKVMMLIGLSVLVCVAGCGGDISGLSGEVYFNVVVYGNGTIEYSVQGEPVYYLDETFLVYPVGTKVTLTAKPANGYYLYRWTNSNGEFISDSVSITVTMDHSPYIICADFFHGTTTQPTIDDLAY